MFPITAPDVSPCHTSVLIADCGKSVSDDAAEDWFSASGGKTGGGLALPESVSCSSSGPANVPESTRGVPS